MTTKEEYEKNMYFEHEGKQVFVEGNALDYLLEHHNDSIFFLGGRLVNDKKEERDCIYLALNCNDLFWWAMADWEIISFNDIESIYKSARENDKWGTSKWACKKRGMRPQHPIEDDMKKEGAWDDELEALPERGNTG